MSLSLGSFANIASKTADAEYAQRKGASEDHFASHLTWGESEKEWMRLKREFQLLSSDE